MKLVPKSVASWCTAWPALAARWRSPWPTWCRSSTCHSTTPMTSSSAKSPTSHQTSTSWGSSLTLRGHWVLTAPVTTARPMTSSSSPRPRITMCSSWTLWSPHETPWHGVARRETTMSWPGGMSSHSNECLSFPSPTWEAFWANSLNVKMLKSWNERCKAVKRMRRRKRKRRGMVAKGSWDCFSEWLLLEGITHHSWSPVLLPPPWFEMQLFLPFGIDCSFFFLFFNWKRKKKEWETEYHTELHTKKGERNCSAKLLVVYCWDGALNLLTWMVPM